MPCPSMGRIIVQDFDCPTCSKPVNDTGVQCDWCDSWYHFKCVGQKPLPVKTCSAIANIEEIKVFCNDCLAVWEAMKAKRSRVEAESAPVPRIELDNEELEVEDHHEQEKREDPQPAKAKTGNESPGLRIVYGPDDPLSNFYEFDFRYNAMNVRSVEHYYQFRRGIQGGQHGLAKRIRSARTAAEAKRLGRSVPGHHGDVVTWDYFSAGGRRGAPRDFLEPSVVSRGAPWELPPGNFLGPPGRGAPARGDPGVLEGKVYLKRFSLNSRFLLVFL